MPEPPQEEYQRRLAIALSEERRLEAWSGRLGLLRFLVFLVALALFMAASEPWPAWLPRSVTLSLAVLSSIGFLVLIVHHARVLNQRDRARHLAEVNRRGLARLDGTWARYPPGAGVSQIALAAPGYAKDLDLHGAGSLFALCNCTHTFDGEQALARALARAYRPEADTAHVEARQQAVKELAPLVDLRQSLEVAGRVLTGPNGSRPDPERLLRWAEGAAMLGPWARWLVGLPLLTAPLLFLWILWGAAPRWIAPALLTMLTAQAMIVLGTAKAVSRLIADVASGHTSLAAYAELMEIVVRAPLHAPLNASLKASLARDGFSPEMQMRRLEGLFGSLQLRQNPFLWLPLNLICLWDLFFALRLERWQARVGRYLRGWLRALGEIEARASLASLAFDHPRWAWPEFVASPACFAAAELGHPLIPPDRSVGNDVTLPGPGHALLVTGSNMSGKSTLLRSIGLCQVLAQAGGPVCARRARLSPLVLRTVMRVEDDLAQGLSRFYAELKRLKEVSDAAARAGRSGEPPLCYLLDEILHGTNTREREIGARLIIKALCRRGAMGVISTHDVSLASLEDETGGAVKNVHFTDSVRDGEMTFDYRLHEGPVRSTNALRLMQLCGIEVDWEDEAASLP